MRIEQIAFKRGYRVTEEGLFLNPSCKEIGTISNRGYLTTNVRINTNIIKLTCHRLQAFQKYGVSIYDKGIVVRHKNGISSNNSWVNILIGTQSDNLMDIPKHIRIKHAQHATSFMRKYNKEEVKNFHRKSKSYKETMEKFGITSKGTLSYILNN